MATPMDVDLQPERDSSHFNLNDFPDEILLSVMSHLNDTSLLHMTRTCKRFQAIAKETFENKCKGDADNLRYQMNILTDSDDHNRKRYRPFLCTFGENIRAIRIIFDDCDAVCRNHWIYDSLHVYCTSLNDLEIHFGYAIDLTRILLQQPRLTRLYMNNTQYIDSDWTSHSFPNLSSLLLNFVEIESNQRRNLDDFFRKNRQLTELSIEHQDGKDSFNIVDSLNSKLNLRLLHVHSYFNVPHFEATIVTMDRLETLTLGGTYSSYAILGAISKGCKQIRKLKMLSDKNVDWNAAVSAICRLEKLTKLKICAHDIGVKHLQHIVNSLRHLEKLHLRSISCKSDAFDQLPCIISSGAKLTKVTVEAFERFESVSLSSKYIKLMAELTLFNNRLKATVPSGRDQLVFAGGEASRGNTVIYCCGKPDPMNDPSTLKLLDMTDSILEKVIASLDAECKCALYNSCTRLQNIVKDYITSHVFYAESTTTGENVFQTIGPHISRISVKTYSLTLWQNINRYCPAIAEFTATEYCFPASNRTRFVWPNVKKLIVKYPKNFDYHNLQTFECPMLAQLEICSFDADIRGVHFYVVFAHGDAFRNLTILKFGCYNESVAKFLLGLNDTICQQIKVLSLDNTNDAAWEKWEKSCRKLKLSNSQLINILMRFRNVRSLRMLLPGLADLSTQHLFENCTKLTDIEFCLYLFNDDSGDIFAHIKNNCKDIRFIRVVAPRKRFELSRWHEVGQSFFPNIKIEVSRST